MRIGTTDLGERPVVLAPMEDVTDIGFRTLCRKMGAALVYSEFVSCDALTRFVNSTMLKLRVNDCERPVAIQIYGKDPAAMAEAARIVEQESRPEIIDINFGCPVKKIAGKGAGAGLLQNVPLMLRITESVAKAVSTPVTVKTRLGWDCDNVIIGDLAPMLQDAGAQAVTVHGRTRSQMYKGEADWSHVARLKADARLRIPVIGNGDITTAAQATDAFDRFGVDAVMIGRATFGRPWIFKEVHDLMHPDAPLDTAGIVDSGYEPMTPDWKLDVLKEQVRMSVERIDEYRGILHIRRHLAATPLFKGIPDFRQKRIAMLRAETLADLFGIMEDIRPLLPR